MKLKNKRIPIAIKVFLLALAYFLSGYFSLELAISSSGITPILPAAGVAFIGIYFWGYRVWPGVALGSFGIDLAVWIETLKTGSFHPSLVSMGIAIGASVQALFVVWSFKKFCNPSQFFNNVQNVLWFAVLPTGIGAFISPVLGTLTIYLSGFGDWNSFNAYVASGWLAESTGILIVVSLVWLLVINKSPFVFNKDIRGFEFYSFIFFLFVTGQIVFGQIIGGPNYPLVYALFPFLVWAVFRFDARTTLITSFLICCFAIWGTINQNGPFVGRSNFETLILLQAYCWFVMVTALILIGAVTERIVSENRLRESNRLLDSIRDIQNKYMTEIESKVLFNDLLNKFINLTDSAFGFIGEIVYTDQGAPSLKAYSITNIAWNEATRKIYDDSFEMGFQFDNMDTLFGEAILSEKTVISNSPKQDQRSGGLPPGHPDLNSFLGIPIHVEKQLIGMVGVANRTEGYQEEIVKFLEPLIATSGQLMLKFRKENERLEIESQLRLEREKLKSIADKLPALVAYVDSEMRYRFNNRAYFDWMGLTPQELKGKKVEEVLGKKGFLSIKPYIESVLNGEPQFYEANLPHPKGKGLRFISATYIPHKNSKGVTEGYTALIHDLTDRKKAEEEIAERERQLKSILDNTPAIIFMKDLQGRYLLVNKKNEEVIGLKNEEIVGKTTHELFPKEIADKFIENDQRVINELRAIEVEELVPLNGDLRTMFSVQFPLRNEDGILYGICGISTDITERKIAEKKLQEYKDQLENIIQDRTKELTKANEKLNEITRELQISEERTKFALDATADGFWDWNLETNKVFFSDTWMESLGYEPGELESSLDSWKKLVHPADMPKVMEALTPHLEGKTPFYQCENRLLTKSGDWRWNLDRGRVVKRNANGVPLRMVGSDTDISEQKLAEEALGGSQMELAQAQEIAHIGSWSLDIEKNHLLWSDEVYKMFGLKPQEFAASYEAFLERVHPDDREFVDKANKESIYEKKEYNIEYRIALPDESVKVVHEQSKTFYDDDGKPSKVFGTVHDITDRKKAEEILKKTQDQILHMEKLSALGKLTGSIAHEFNNPIYGTKIILEQLREEADLTDRQMQGLHLAIKECYRMSDLISKLRDFYQPTSKIPERVDIHNLLFDVLLLMKNKLREKKISVENELDEDLPEVVAVGDQIKQVLLNVIQNAEDSYPEASIQNKLKIKTEANGANITICIQDNGVGISKENIKNIFDPFFTTKPAVKGTGLGLSISHGIIKDHGGNIEAKSKLGHGSTFIIKLPIEANINEKS
jgi:PAS domain S-box-containing protein